MTRFIVLTFCLTLFLSGCQEDLPEAEKNQPVAAQNTVATPPQTVASTNSASMPVEIEREPPRPPLKEDFQGEPRISLFPRVGNFQPKRGDETFGYWRAFIDHLVKVTKVVENQSDANRAWSFRSIDTLESLGYFAPIAVEPNTDYQISFDLIAELPEEASAGIGVLEFDEFLWIGEQYTEEVYEKHFQKVHPGQRLTGSVEGTYSFEFKTGGKTRMIHIILFRDGKHARQSLIFDNIEIVEVD